MLNKKGMFNTTFREYEFWEQDLASISKPHFVEVRLVSRLARPQTGCFSGCVGVWEACTMIECRIGCIESRAELTPREDSEGN